MASPSRCGTDQSPLASSSSDQRESNAHLSKEEIDQLLDNLDDTLEHSFSQDPPAWLANLPPSWQTSSIKMTRRDQVRALLGHVPDTNPRLADGEVNKHLPDHRTYVLTVVEQPVQCRMSGFNNRDKRPIDPAPIVKLMVYDENQNVDQESFHNPFFAMIVSLWSSDRSEVREVSVPNNQSSSTPIRILTGSLVSSASALYDLNDECGLYFAFPDLSTWIPGEFCLKFNLIHLGRNTIVASVFSDVFTVYTAKTFPGMRESSALAKCLAKQGLKIPIRNKVRPAKSQRTDAEDEST